MRATCSTYGCLRARYQKLASPSEREILVESFDNGVFDLGGRYAGDRADLCYLRLTVEVGQRDVVAIPQPGPGRVCRHHAMTGIVKQQAGQQMITGIADSASGGPLIAELLLNLIE